MRRCDGARYTIPVAEVGTTAECERHVQDLCLTPSTSSFGPNAAASSEPLRLGYISDDGTMLSVPRGYGLNTWGDPHIAAPLRMDRTNMVFKGTLIPDRGQCKAAAAALGALRGHNCAGCCLELPCGFGKTVVALHIAAELRARTIVLVHTHPLLEQWVQRIGTFVPDAKVGRISGELDARVNIADCDVVVAMLQSLHRRVYPAPVLEGFDLVIVDECHHVPASTFTSALGKIPAALTLGLTATPNRKDGLTKLMYWLLGCCVYRAQRRGASSATVQWYALPRDPSMRSQFMKGGRARDRHGEPILNCAAMITSLCADTERTAAIARDLRCLVDDGRHVIVLSDRVQQLRALLADVTRHAPDVTAGIMIGATKHADRATLVAQSRVLLTTYAMAAEGLDVPSLDAAVLASPKSDVVQAVGRVLRTLPGKRLPLILDYCDEDLRPFPGQFEKRMRYFRREKFKIVRT